MHLMLGNWKILRHRRNSGLIQPITLCYTSISSRTSISELIGAEIRMHDRTFIVADKCDKNSFAEYVDSGLT